MRGTAIGLQVIARVDHTPCTTCQWHVVIIWPFFKLTLSPNLTWWSDSQQLTGGFNFIPHKRPHRPRGGRSIMAPQGAATCPENLPTPTQPSEWQRAKENSSQLCQLETSPTQTRSRVPVTQNTQPVGTDTKAAEVC